MYASLFFLLIFPFIFYRLGMRKSFFTYGYVFFSIVLFLLGFLFSGLMTFIFMNSQVRTWTIPDAWVNTISIDASNLYMIMALPFIFVADLVRWVLYIMFFHGNFIMWIIMLVVIVKIIKMWVVGIHTFNEFAPKSE